MNKSILSFALTATLSLLTACGGDDAEPLITPIDPNAGGQAGGNSGTGNQPGSTPGLYHEQYRPQIHYTPARNWVNDPNGMVYLDGTWHLYYQYNPYGNDWGNMSWGHATSTDLLHWAEQPVALQRDALGDIFSGSAVVDHNNSAGFGQGAVVAFYTSAGQHQQQSMAYSTDHLRTLTPYQGNPVIANTDRPDFRDPKVFWHEPTQQWVMALALGWKCELELWTSRDLRTWRYASTFKTDVPRCHGCQWECPDLIELPYEGGSRWVMILNVNPGGPTAGSGIQCFIGHFDGTTFTAEPLDYPMWMDTGMDNYAGVTWSNAPDGRRILLGWMNNWAYSGGVPCAPWRSAFTLPRQLSLVQIDGKPCIASHVVSEIDQIAGPWQDIPSIPSLPTSLSAYHLQLTLPTTANTTFALANDKGEQIEFTYNVIYRTLAARRTSATGATCSSFSMPSVAGRILTPGNEVTLDVYVDQSSVEVFSADGTFTMTNLVFPTSIYNQIAAPTATALRWRELKSIWQ